MCPAYSRESSWQIYGALTNAISMQRQVPCDKVALLGHRGTVIYGNLDKQVKETTPMPLSFPSFCILATAR